MMFILWFWLVSKDLGFRFLCNFNAFLCGHLSHGVSSAFQSLGIRSENWRLNSILLQKPMLG